MRSSSLQNCNGSAVGESYGGKLRLFIDTADSESWQRWLPSGAFYGWAATLTIASFLSHSYEHSTS